MTESLVEIRNLQTHFFTDEEADYFEQGTRDFVYLTMSTGVGGDLTFGGNPC